MKTHHYNIQLNWTGNEGQGTTNYQAYKRSHTIAATNKYGEILGSSDPSFKGDTTKYNPEELFLSSIASCHMLWYLHLCSVNNIIVTAYEDNPKGTMTEIKNGSGAFTEVTLFPKVTITDKSNIELAKQLHEEANNMCFIANSCNFKIKHVIQIIIEA